MDALREVSAWIADRLPALLEEHEVPAASVGVSVEGDVVRHAAGVLSTSTGVEATTDSVFQIGSITKLWTATLVMQLVDEGLVDLDDVVRKYLPEFRIADEDAASRITIRHLLTHTSGFEGDIFTDTGVGDDCVEKYLGVLHHVPQLFAPGELWSYNNAAFCVLGRLVEVLRGAPYDVCVRTHLVEPLGLNHVAPSPYDAVLFRAAVGHYQTSADAPFEPTKVWALTRSNIPAGSMLAMDSQSLLAFANAHLGLGPSVLAPGTSEAMRAKAVELPYLGHLGTSWGLGFERFDTPEGAFVGHDGNTIGQSAYLRMVPEAGLAFTVLTNGGRASALAREVGDHVLSELVGRTLPPEPVPPADPVSLDATPFLGRYTSEIGTLVVSRQDDGTLWLDAIPEGDLAEELGEQPERHELVGYSEDTLISKERDGGIHRLYAFLGDRDGHAAYLHAGRAMVYAGD